MSVKNLLNPRYRVTNDWPDSVRNESLVGLVYEWVENLHNPDQKAWCSTYDKYPHLFKKLQWWEDRKESEMPEYVLCHKTGVVLKVTRHFMSATKDFFEHDVKTNWEGWVHYSWVVPATKKEYDQSQLKK